MKNLTENLSYKNMLTMWFPLVLSGLFGEIYSLINTIISSHYINSDAIAVMGSVSPFNSLKSFIFNGMTLGFGLVVCRTFEEKKWTYYKKTLSLAACLTGMLCASILIAFPFIDSLMCWCNVPALLRSEAKPYLFFLLTGCISIAVKNLLATIITGMGEMKIIGAASVAGVLLQSFLSYLFIGVLHTGVWGASCSVVTTDTFIALLLLISFIRRTKEFHASCSNTSDSISIPAFGKRLSEMVRSGLAKPIMMGFVAIGAFYFQSAINNLPVHTIAGFSYAETLINIFMAPICSVASLGAAIGSQNTSAWEGCKENGFYERRLFFQTAKNKMNTIALVWSLFSILCMWLFAPQMISFLGENGMSPDIITAGMWKLRISIFGFPFLSLYLINRAIFHSMGKNRYMPFLGFLEMTFAIIGSIFFIPRYGYIAAAIFILIKWSVPGIVSEVSIRRHL